jgi:predicted secreted Zn-dependent protease
MTAPMDVSAVEAAGAIQDIWLGNPAIYAPPAIPATETKFFVVNGFTQRELINSLNTSGICITNGPCATDPAVPNGVAWALEGIDFIPGLYCYTPQTSPLPFKAFVLLPRWAPYITSVTVTLMSRWDALAQALYIHEAGHAAISNQDLAALLSQARALPTCQAVVDFWASPTLFNKEQADQAAYHARLHADCRPEIGCLPAGWLGW